MHVALMSKNRYQFVIEWLFLHGVRADCDMGRAGLLASIARHPAGYHLARSDPEEINKLPIK
jgi:hypothetical protein